MIYRNFGARRAVGVLAHAFALSLLATVPVAHASHIGESLTLDQQLVTTNDQLLAGLAQYQKLPGNQRAAYLPTLVKLAQHRQEHMIALMEQAPTVAAARMMPAALRARLPAQAAALVETEVRVQGDVFAHVADNFEAGRSKSTFKLKGRGDPTALNIFLGDPNASERDLQRASGKQAAVTAMRIGDNLLLLDRHALQAAGATTTTTSTGSLVAAGTVVQGDQKTLSVLLNFSDKALTCTASDVQSRLFGATGSTVNNNYQQSSRGLVSFSGNAVGPFTINYASTGACDYSGWAAAADAAVKAAGIDATQYTRINYVTPSNSTCGWSGLAYMPGRQSWVQSCSATGVFSHELGHNISLHHAGTPSAEYGDGSDPMGGARVVNHNGANRTMAGWMPSGSVLDVGTGGSYALATISTNTTAGSPQVLRIVKPDTGEYYYVSVREALNLDAALSTAYVDNISVHRATGTLPAKTFLLQNVAGGQSFVDSANGITITNQGVLSGLATVAVTFNGGSCTRSAPVVSVAPASQTAAPGATVNYSVSVTNRNTASCGSSSFSVAQALPSGFAGRFGATSLAIAAGASATTSWAVTSPTTALPATYTVSVTAQDSTAGNPTTAHASDIVFVDGGAPVVAITSPAAGATVTGRVSIAATASDNTAIRQVEFYVDGALIATDTAASYGATWNARKAAPGLHTIKARALDTAGNAAEKSITVTVR